MNRTLLEPPAARQGPGPIPQSLIDALDVAVTRLLAHTLPGDRRAAGVGLGIAGFSLSLPLSDTSVLLLSR